MGTTECTGQPVGDNGVLPTGGDQGRLRGREEVAGAPGSGAAPGRPTSACWPGWVSMWTSCSLGPTAGGVGAGCALRRFTHGAAVLAGGAESAMAAPGRPTPSPVQHRPAGYFCSVTGPTVPSHMRACF